MNLFLSWVMFFVKKVSFPAKTANELTFGYLEVYKHIKELQPSSVLFQFKIIIIKLTNKQGLIQSHLVDESFYVMLNSLK